MDFLKAIWFMHKEYPFFKWTAIAGVGFYLLGNESLKLLGTYLLMGDAILIAVFFLLMWVSDAEDKDEARKWNSYKFDKSLNQKKYKSNNSFDDTKYPTKSLGVNNKKPEPAPKFKGSFDTTSSTSTKSVIDEQKKIISQPAKTNEQKPAKEVEDITTSKPVLDGDIKCSSCNYEGAPKNFLESSAGNLYRKCPKCSATTQFLKAPKTDGKYKCQRCKLSGEKGAFFPSYAGSLYLCCPSCYANFL